MNAELSEELVCMFEEDQNATLEEFVLLQKRHGQRICAIIAEHGWLDRDLVGDKGAHAAWLLVQHDFEVSFQKGCLRLMKKSNVASVDIAYLTDRILVTEGKKQLYGTQFGMDGGEYGVLPLEDPDSIEVRREKMGFEQSFADYEEYMLQSR